MGKGENSFSSFALFCFVSFYFSRAPSTSRKKKAAVEWLKKSFSSSDLI